jgi:hypothetical protein
MEPASGWRIHDKARGSARLWIRVPRIRWTISEHPQGANQGLELLEYSYYVP